MAPTTRLTTALTVAAPMRRIGPVIQAVTTMVRPMRTTVNLIGHQQGQLGRFVMHVVLDDHRHAEAHMHGDRNDEQQHDDADGRRSQNLRHGGLVARGSAPEQDLLLRVVMAGEELKNVLTLPDMLRMTPTCRPRRASTHQYSKGKNKIKNSSLPKKLKNVIGPRSQGAAAWIPAIKLMPQARTGFMAIPPGD